MRETKKRDRDEQSETLPYRRRWAVTGRQVKCSDELHVTDNIMGHASGSPVCWLSVCVLCASAMLQCIHILTCVDAVIISCSFFVVAVVELLLLPLFCR